MLAGVGALAGLRTSWRSVQDWPIAKIVTRFVTYLMDTLVFNSYIAKIFKQTTGHSSHETVRGPSDFLCI